MSRRVLWVDMRCRNSYRSQGKEVSLGWHVCRTKLARTFFRGNFHTKNAPKFSVIFEPLFCGSSKNQERKRHINIKTFFR